jgi:ribosome biogenesis GTPase
MSGEDQQRGRVVSVHRINVDVVTDDGETVAVPDPDTDGPPELPVVGDWVLLEQRPDVSDPVIVEVLPRRTVISRRDPADRLNEQVLAANVDVVFVVQGLDHELNLRRLERSMVVAFDSGATPVLVLTKADLADDPEGSLEAAKAIAPDLDVHLTSTVTGQGIDELRHHARPDRTVALLGPSGAGKSSLVNQLLREERQEIADVREVDAKGRHTTTRREMIPLPGGGVIIDTPGLRGLGLWEASEGIALAFADIEALAADCQFRDCMHDTEPGCAVKAAIEEGTLDQRRLESWLRLHAELANVEQQQREQQQLAGEGKRRPPRRGQAARRGGHRKKRR